jgi:hypothetical protein
MVKPFGRIRNGRKGGGIWAYCTTKQIYTANLEIHIALAEAYSEAGRKEDAWRERMESLHPTSSGAAPPANP